MSFNNTLALLSSSDPLQVIAVFNKANRPIFQDALNMHLSVDPEYVQAVHPLEDGTEVTDNRIEKPVDVELVFLLPSFALVNTYQEINNVAKTGALINVQTRVGRFLSMSVIGFPHQETADMQDAILITLKVRTVNFANSTLKTFSPVAKKDESTTNRGTIQNKPATPKDISDAKVGLSKTGIKL
jgi:hypothetical protein